MRASLALVLLLGLPACGRTSPDPEVRTYKGFALFGKQRSEVVPYFQAHRLLVASLVEVQRGAEPPARIVVEYPAGNYKTGLTGEAADEWVVLYSHTARVLPSEGVDLDRLQGAWVVLEQVDDRHLTYEVVGTWQGSREPTVGFRQSEVFARNPELVYRG